MSRKRPIEFRKEEVAYVMQRWQAADSCSLVGVGSVGKSNLLQHLADPEVQAHYLGKNSTQFKAIVIDPNMLGPLPSATRENDPARCWAGYELMMHRLFLAFYPFTDLQPEESMRFYDAYRAMQDGSNPLYAYMGLRYLEFGLDFFLRRGFRIVFMFDEFEEMFHQLPVKFFQTLRGLRDTHKNQLSFLTFTRLPLPVVSDAMQISILAIEPFTELFTDNVLYVGPYNETDARNMVEDLMRRNQKNYYDSTIDFLLWATGRYAGLLRSGFRVLDSVGFLSPYGAVTDQLVQQMASKLSVRTECRTIWQSLSTQEQQILKAIVRLSPYSTGVETELAVAMLVQKRLLRLIPVDRTKQQLEIEPPVFRAFVASNPEVD